MKAVAVLVGMTVLVGCQATGETYSPPTFSFPADARASKGALALQFSDNGWKIDRETDSTIVFRTSRFDAGLGGALMTCGACQPPEVELQIIAAQSGKTTTVRYDLTWIVNPKSFREQRVNPTGPKGEISSIVETQIELARKRVGGAGPVGAR